MDAHVSLLALGITFVLVLAITTAAGAPTIGALKGISFRQTAYEDAPKTHAKKSGTPTMGGLLFIIALVGAVIADPGRETFALLGIGTCCGLVGFIDDYTSVRRGRNRGLRARPKFLATAVVAALFLIAITYSAPAGATLPVGTVFSSGDLFGRVRVVAPYAIWFALSLLAILATTHAVNLTDGLDGLAGGTMIPPLAVVAWIGWHSGASGVAFVAVATIAALVGFLVYNRHPARVFMGDTGALLLGGVLAGSVVLTGTQLLLPLIGGVFAAEALSVIIQVLYFKRTHKRIFRMSPLHHHFELGGWPETKVTTRFWTASALLSLVGLAIVR